MGESDTLIRPVSALQTEPEFWSYVHASHQSANVIDQCGEPVAFPGCVIRYGSQNDGTVFEPLATDPQSPTCLFACISCPCQSERDHIDQQQYPRVVEQAGKWWMVYEYRASVFLRRSNDGVAWGPPEQIPLTGIWQEWLMGCAAHERIGEHPYVAPEFDCLIGGPPGLFVEDSTLYVFVGLGQNPGAMGCYRGAIDQPTALFRKCTHNPLFVGASTYGPVDSKDAQTNPHFDFRTISSAELTKIGDHYYMLYEGVRGPGAGDGGDTQFALGLARSVGNQIDGKWETYAQNPILIEQPGNVGVGHADLISVDGATWLYTSLDGVTRSRLRLVWK